MKKYLILLLLSLATVSCYDNYIFDYAYSGVYFPYQIDVRTFVVGEGMKIEVGAALGGVRENNMDRTVNFELKSSLITPAVLALFKASSYAYVKDPTTPVVALQQLPANYYTLSDNSTMVIKKGEHMGSVVVKADSANFLADPATSVATYVLPFNITSADADSVLNLKRYAIIGLRYENMLFGKYWHGGSALVNRPAKSDTTIKYFTTIPMPENKIWTLTTTAPDALFASGYLDQVTGKKEMKLTLSDGNITISAGTGSTFTIAPDGASAYNQSKLLQNRKIFLKYTYTNTVSGYTYHCTDTLTFRNRIRDGINEMQDTDPTHY